MRAFLGIALIVLLPLTAAAQDRAQTLADIRSELAALNGAVASLRAELSTSGTGGVAPVSGLLLDRVDTIEASLAQLTSKAEALEFRINQIVADGTRRLGDLEFRLVELEGGDISKIGQAPVLGGESSVPAPAPATPAPGGSLATNEQADFDRAKGVLGQGDFRSAADLFAAFAETYTGGPLTHEAHFLRGEALSGLGDTGGAARAWLEAFSGDMTGPRAPEALLKVGQALGTLGQGPEACVTLQEVGARFPGTPSADQATTAMLGLGCR